MKPFLLIAGDNYYPSPETFDWKGCFSSFEEAKDQLIFLDNGKVQIKIEAKSNEYVSSYDWWGIVDLREWIF